MPRVGGGQDLLMRQDGYVTASEVAKATGKNLATVHRAIEAESIPGARVGRAWYVDIHRYYNLGEYPVGTQINESLRTLTMIVGRPASGKVPKAAPKKTTARASGARR